MKLITSIATLATLAYSQDVLQLKVRGSANDCISSSNGAITHCVNNLEDSKFTVSGVNSKICSKKDSQSCINRKGKISENGAVWSRNDFVLKNVDNNHCWAVKSSSKSLKKIACSSRPMPSKIDSNGYLKTPKGLCFRAKRKTVGSKVVLGSCDSDNKWTLSNGYYKHDKTRGCLSARGKKVYLEDCMDTPTNAWDVGVNFYNNRQKKCIIQKKGSVKLTMGECISFLDFVKPVSNVTTAAPALKGRLVNSGLKVGFQKWSLEFGLKVRSFQDKTVSVLSIGANQFDRRPAIEILPDSSSLKLQLSISEPCNSTSAGNIKRTIIRLPKELNKDLKVRITSEPYYDSAAIRTYINGQEEEQLFVNGCDKDYITKVYAGNPWVPVADAAVTNIQFNGVGIELGY